GRPAGDPEVLHAGVTTFHTLTWLHTIMAVAVNVEGIMSAIGRKWPAVAFAAMLALGIAPGAAQAQTYPSKPIHIVVPYAPGGITDVIARALGQRLSETWKQQVVVETKPTGAGTVGIYSLPKPAPHIPS